MLSISDVEPCGSRQARTKIHWIDQNGGTCIDGQLMVNDGFFL